MPSTVSPPPQAPRVPDRHTGRRPGPTVFVLSILVLAGCALAGIAVWAVVSVVFGSDGPFPDRRLAIPAGVDGWHATDSIAIDGAAHVRAFEQDTSASAAFRGFQAEAGAGRADLRVGVVVVATGRDAPTPEVWEPPRPAPVARSAGSDVSCVISGDPGGDGDGTAYCQLDGDQTTVIAIPEPGADVSGEQLADLARLVYDEVKP
ncbi:MAG: hypothetical protein GEU93_14305 [Propionibacteriales bacterium]|nr:hypothetical protein [Propionibacteriales bacterium]